jgi:23S rRNA U2552 (ribose-2'-O)-methylase RlmE/FtsJ
VNPISEILKRSGSDKATGHSYDVVYAPFLEKLRETAKSVLEIGVYKGGSMRAWHEVFPNATIVGVDVAYHAELKLPADRAVFVKADATKKGSLAAIIKHGPFDVIIDDGNHQPEAQRITHALLMPHLKPGGLYIIEDVKTLEIARMLAKKKGFIVDLRFLKNKHDDILVIYEKN